jgi:hypothetical protein
MKTRIFVSIFSFIVIVILILGGCASSGKITEPTHAESVLLVGRIKATCEEFEEMWNMNGEHTDKIEIDIRNLSTNEMTTVRSKGANGVFYVNEAQYGVYTIERFSYTSRGSRTVFNLGHLLNDGVNFTLDQNAVYNLGDIEWYAKCKKRESKEYKDKGAQYIYEVETMHYYQENFNALKVWFEATYPESSWNNRNWINVEYTKR